MSNTKPTTPEMLSSPQEATTPPSPTVPYDSNPFTLAFSAFGRLFDKNLGWAIAFLVLGFIGLTGQIVENSVSTPSSNEVSTRAVEDRMSTLSPEQLFAVISVVGIILFIAALIMVISICVQIFINGMFAYAALHSEKGQKVPLQEAFQAVRKRFWRLLWANILAFIKIFLWTLLFIVPGIIAAFRYALLTFVIMDEPETNKGIVASHTRVKSLVKGRLFEVFGLIAGVNLIPIVGGLLQLSGGAAQYHQLAASYNNGNPQRPPVHWVNYVVLAAWIGLIIILLLAVLFLLIIFTATLNP